MTQEIGIRDALLANKHPHLVCLTPTIKTKSALLKSFLLEGLPCQGSSFLLSNGTKVTLAHIGASIPSEAYHLVYHNWELKSPTKEIKQRVLQWEKKAVQVINIFE